MMAAPNVARVQPAPRSSLGALAFAIAVLATTFFIQGLWSVLLSLNIRALPIVPWSVAIAAPALWALWRYVGGAWGPHGTQAARRHYLKAAPLRAGQWSAALFAGFLALGALIALWLVLTQLVPFSTGTRLDLSAYPPLTVAGALLMSSVLGGVVEEAGLRGYMLTRLLGVLPAPLAIVAVALAIAPGHALTQGAAVPIVLWYFASDVTFGTLVYRSGSILPAICVHAVGLLLFFAFIWPTDRFRGVVTVSTAGPGVWLALFACAVLGVAAVVVLCRLTPALPDST